MMTNKVLDTSGLNCPLPILKTRKKIMTMKTGDVLKVIATDPASADDFPAFAKATGNKLLSVEKTDKHWIYRLKVG